MATQRSGTATRHGRGPCAAPAELAPPLRELSFAGLVIGSGNDLKHFFHFTRSFESFRFVIARVCSHLWDLVRHGRGMRLVNGNALAARLGKSLFDLGVPLWLNTAARELLREGDARSDNRIDHVSANIADR